MLPSSNEPGPRGDSAGTLLLFVAGNGLSSNAGTTLKPAVQQQRRDTVAQPRTPAAPPTWGLPHNPIEHGQRWPAPSGARILRLGAGLDGAGVATVADQTAIGTSLGKTALGDKGAVTT
jgi:hypothetical protein